MTEARRLSNPFPQDPVATDSVERLADFRETQCYHVAREKLEIYREGFFHNLPGVALGIRGEYGSGKTHLVLQLMDHLTETKTPLFKAIYSKAEFTDIREFYINQFARKIEFSDLRDVFSLHVAKLMRLKASAQTFSGPKTLTEIAVDEVRDLLAENPQGVLTLLEEDLLPGENLSEDLKVEVKESSKGVAVDFFRAYSKLIDPALSPTALRWIQGEQLSISEMKDLGLETRGITSSDDAREALRFLLGAFKRADYGIMFCLEEFERPVLRGTAADQRASFGLLKDLAELFKGTGHVLVISGVSEAWDNLPPDVLDRIKRTDTIQVSFVEPEARGVLNAYTLTVEQRVEDIFEPAALKLLFDISKLNARRLLSLAHHSYEFSDGKISENALQKATNRVLSGPTRLDNLEKSIESVAGSFNLTVRKGGQLDGQPYDFLLGEINDPSVIIELKKSIFKLGEIQAARSIADSSKRLKRDHPHISLCVVVVGYSTTEVRDELTKVVDRVFNYDEETFANDFQAFLKSVVDAAAQAKQRTVEEKDYRNFDERLNELQESRQMELERIQTALAELQKETARRYQETSDKRRTDKLVEALSESERLLQEEEELAFSTSKPPSWLPPKQKFDVALKLLDEQSSAVQTIGILNEKLPDAGKFSDELWRLRYLLDTSERIWANAHGRTEADDKDLFLDNFFEFAAVRRVYRERRETLTLLEAIHASRMSNEGTNFLVSAFRKIRKLSLPVLLLWILSIGGIIFNVILFSSFFLRERTSSTEYVNAISGIQQTAGQIAIDSTLTRTERGDTLGQSLLENVSALDSLSTLHSLSTSQQVYLSRSFAEIRRLAPLVRRVLKEPHETSAYYSDNAGEIVKQCKYARSSVDAGSSYELIKQFVQVNPLAIFATFFFLLGLGWFILQDRARERRARRPIDFYSIPEINRSPR